MASSALLLVLLRESGTPLQLPSVSSLDRLVGEYAADFVDSEELTLSFAGIQAANGKYRRNRKIVQLADQGYLVYSQYHPSHTFKIIYYPQDSGYGPAWYIQTAQEALAAYVAPLPPWDSAEVPDHFLQVPLQGWEVWDQSHLYALPGWLPLPQVAAVKASRSPVDSRVHGIHFAGKQEVALENAGATAVNGKYRRAPQIHRAVDESYVVYSQYDPGETFEIVFYPKESEYGPAWYIQTTSTKLGAYVAPLDESAWFVEQFLDIPLTGWRICGEDEAYGLPGKLPLPNISVIGDGDWLPVRMAKL